MLRFLLVAAAILLISCTDEDGARQVLRAQGMTDIHTDGYGWFDCSESDIVRTAFTARSHIGLPVAGTVCCGLVFKNCTIRYE